MGQPKRKSLSKHDSQEIDSKEKLIFLKRYRAAKLKFSFIQKLVSKEKNLSESEITVQQDYVSNLLTSYDELLNLLVDFEQDCEFETLSVSMETFHNELTQMKALLIKKSTAFTNKNTTKNQKDDTPSDVINRSRPKLPDLPIPVFTGNPGDWVVFKNTFVALVHSDSNLSGVVKFSYLLDRLNAEVKTVLGTISLTNEGYEVAWKNLNECYDNQRKIIEYHIDQLLSLPVISKNCAKEVRQLINQCTSNLAALELCQQNLDSLGEQLLINIIIKKLNFSLHKEWEEELDSNSLPSLNKLMDFLKRKCRVFVSVEPLKGQAYNNQNKSTGFGNMYKNSQTFVNTNNELTICRCCEQGRHLLVDCPRFLAVSSFDRYKIAKEFKLCINCLKSRHPTSECKAVRCQKCSKLHHTTLHHNQAINPISTTSNSDENNFVQLQNTSNVFVAHNSHSNNMSRPSQVLLPTVTVLVKDNRGKYHECRALLDSGSQSNFITSEMADKFHMNRQNLTSHAVNGINGNATSITEQVKSDIKSKNKHYYERNVSFYVVNTIAKRVPQYKFDITYWKIPSQVKLSDQMFSSPNPIDMLLGSDIFFKILKSNKVSIGPGLPVFHETCFGWIATGKEDPGSSFSFHVSENSPPLTGSGTQSTSENLQELLKRFFELDPIITKPILSEEEQECQSHFERTHRRDPTGRYIVSLPLKNNVSELGESKSQAWRRFLSLERKLDDNPEFKASYKSVLDEYLDLGHMIKIDENLDLKKQLIFYMPHHSVIKLSSTTTKIRVVFDASAKSTTNISLNDTMMIGPTIQESLFNIVLRFRKHQYVFCADLCKMYRQILIEESQRSLQRILWRSEKNEEIKTYQLNTVTFGTAAAPYLATRTLQQLALDERMNFPKASEVSLKDFYVDDCLSGSNSISEAKEIIMQLKEMFSKGGFSLTKWCSNEQKLLENIPKEEQELLKVNDGSNIECIKALGITWHPMQDKFTFIVPQMTKEVSVTKRTILSQVAKIYDPLGLISPVIIIAKMLIQKMWKEKSNWDDKVSGKIEEAWSEYQSGFKNLELIKLDRHIFCKNPVKTELHGFADASEAAYGAVFYVKSVDKNGKPYIRLLCSKAKISPIKTTSLPRLELCAMLILSRLLKTITESFKFSFDSITLWSDSTIALAWVKTEPYQLKTFIANRVVEIQDITKNFNWRHVRSEQNSADILSRGVMPSDMHNDHRWFQGPEILFNYHCYNNFNPPDNNKFDHKLFEYKPNILSFASTNVDHINNHNTIIERCSSYSRLLRILSYCYRFSKSHRLKMEVTSPIITQKEMEHTLTKIVLLVQREAFPDEIKLLQRNKTVSSKSRIVSLVPFIDTNGVLRVGGRFAHSNYNYDFKHQILLPSKHHFTDLVIRHYHYKYMHAGPNLLSSVIRQKFWPVNLTNSAKKCVKNCVICFRNKPRMLEQIMGDLPPERFTPSRPFFTTGVDYCGPFMIKSNNRRKAPLQKVYVSIFVCFVTKAVHIEMVTDLTTEAFLACLKRFISRRGRPHTIYSDNASTFQGANRELNELLNFIKNEFTLPEIMSYCISEEIIWKFIPPRSPNFGGIWESAVKSFKHHFKRVVMNTLLTYEEFNTLLIQIEGILNSRPITTISSDPNEPLPLTAAHFLCGGSITLSSEPSLTEVATNRLSNWQQVTRLTQLFWKRFSVEYLHNLQQRSKWRTPEDNLKLNDIVLVYDKNIPSNQWLLGIVTKVY